MYIFYSEEVVRYVWFKKFFFSFRLQQKFTHHFWHFFPFFLVLCVWFQSPFFLPWSFWLTYYIDWQKNKCTLKWKKSNSPQSKKCSVLICILQTVADRRFVIFFVRAQHSMWHLLWWWHKLFFCIEVVVSLVYVAQSSKMCNWGGFCLKKN